MEKKVYVLVGDEACEILDELGFESLIDTLKENAESEHDEFRWNVFEFNEYEKVSNVLITLAPYGKGFNFLSTEENRRIMNINK